MKRISRIQYLFTWTSELIGTNVRRKFEKFTKYQILGEANNVSFDKFKGFNGIVELVLFFCIQYNTNQGRRGLYVCINLGNNATCVTEGRAYRREAHRIRRLEKFFLSKCRKAISSYLYSAFRHWNLHSVEYILIFC